MVIVKQDESITTNHFGKVTSNTLVRLKLLNQSFVSISFDPSYNKSACNHDSGVSLTKKFEEHELKRNDYVVQLHIDDNFPDFDLNFSDDDSSNDFDVSPDKINLILDDGVIYVSPLSFFNIFKRNVDLYTRYRESKIRVDLRHLDGMNSSVEQNCASYVDLCLVSCPFGTIEVENIDDILQDYFNKSKLLCRDEIFCVPVNKLMPLTPCFLWFSVKACHCEKNSSFSYTNSLFVTADKSKLVLSNPINSYVPQCTCVYQNDTAMLSLFHNQNYRNVYSKERTHLYNLTQLLKRKLMSSGDLTVLLHGSQGVGKGLFVRSICEDCCLHFYEVNCYDLVGESLTATEKRMKKTFETFIGVGPCILYLKHVELLCKDKEGTHEERKIMYTFSKQLKELTNDYPLLVVGSCESINDLTPRFQSEFLFHYNLGYPSETDRLSLLCAITNDFDIDEKTLVDISKQTSGFVFSDLIAVISNICYSNVENMDTNSSFLNTQSKNFYVIDEEVAYKVVEELRLMKTSGSKDVRIPKVRWEDVGGLQHAKKDILDTIELPLRLPKLFSTNLQRSGLLFYGPPGCGKTLLAKAIATEFTLNFYSVKGPELINMYVGQSEENVRNVFIKARSMVPCIIFFDELDSIAPNRGLSGDSGGVMDRIVSQLLSELDGIHNNANIFVIGATNRPDLLDPALLRPGRFDKVIYIGIPEDRDERLRILKAVTRKLRFSEDVDFESLVDMCPLNLTGADFSALASECLMNCYRRLINEHEMSKSELNPDMVVISSVDILHAFKTLVPSVSVSELERYKQIREQYLKQ